MERVEKFDPVMAYNTVRQAVGPVVGAGVNEAMRNPFHAEATEAVKDMALRRRRPSEVGALVKAHTKESGHFYREMAKDQWPKTSAVVGRAARKVHPVSKAYDDTPGWKAIQNAESLAGVLSLIQMGRLPGMLVRGRGPKTKAQMNNEMMRQYRAALSGRISLAPLEHATGDTTGAGGS